MSRSGHAARVAALLKWLRRGRMLWFPSALILILPHAVLAASVLDASDAPLQD